MNAELAPSLSKITLGRDRKLKYIQLLTTRAMAAVAEIGNWAMQPDPIDRKALLDGVLDSAVILSAASATTNMVRRDILRQKLGHSYRHLCNDVSPNGTNLLGEDISTRVKAQQQSALLIPVRRQQRGRFQPYAYNRGGRGGTATYYQGRGSYRGGFLGKFKTYAAIKINNASYKPNLGTTFQTISDKSEDDFQLGTHVPFDNFYSDMFASQDLVIKQEGHSDSIAMKTELCICDSSNQSHGICDVCILYRPAADRRQLLQRPVQPETPENEGTYQGKSSGSEAR